MYSNSETLLQFWYPHHTLQKLHSGGHNTAKDIYVSYK